MYERTQTAPPVWIAGVIALIVVAVASVGGTVRAIAVVVAVVVLAAGLVFGRMTVVVDDSAVVAAFGRGWPRRRVVLDDVAAVTIVRNRWWYGWGIRRVPGGWMYNVWGLDAVDLELNGGRHFRIGTAEPLALHAAIVVRRSR